MYDLFHINNHNIWHGNISFNIKVRTLIHVYEVYLASQVLIVFIGENKWVFLY